MGSKHPVPNRILPRLDFYQSSLERGRSRIVELIWLSVQALLFSSWLPGSSWRVSILRIFGAKIGKGVVIKPHVRIKFPWRLVIGDFTWIGEQVWIDNLADVQIGSHCCVSQAVYFCTGSHDWSDPRFALITASIVLEDGSWIGAHAILGPGVRVGQGSVLALGSVATTALAPFKLYAGSPAQAMKDIRIAETLSDVSP